jgi:hypothetical protein
MKNYASSLLLCFLIVGLFFLTTEKVFPQSMPDETPQTVTGITTGRAKSIVGGVIGLISVIVAWRAAANTNATSGSQSKRTQAVIALSLGVIAIILSVLHLSTSAGAVFGSGSGKAGAIVALAFGLIGTVRGGMALRPKKQ